MIRHILLFLFTIISLITAAQTKMRTLEELINTAQPGWASVRQWIDSAKNKVEILPVDTVKAKQALYNLQITTRSPMGAIVYETGGLLVDHGWIRILGSGSKKLNRVLPDWNKGKILQGEEKRTGYLLIADDAVGGFFILNGGQLGTDTGKVYYFSPENLVIGSLGLTYSDFLLFIFNVDLDIFYRGLRWKTWKEDVSKLAGDEVFNFYPYLFTKEGKDINNDSRSVVPVEEQFKFNVIFRNKTGTH